MKRAGHVFERMSTFEALRSAALRAALGKRQKPEVAAFLADLESNVLALQGELVAGTWTPRPYRTFSVADPKPRTISAAVFRDRVVHHALCAVLEPLFERVAIFDSYACRPGKGSHAAVTRAQVFCRRFAYVLKLDVSRFFETVRHDVLKDHVRRLVKDSLVLALVDGIIDHGAPGSLPGRGLPIGNLTSQHLANFHLSFVDHVIKQDLGVRGYLRYMDDLVLFADEREHLHAAHAAIEHHLTTTLGLELKKRATRLSPVSEGLPFLGFVVWPHSVRLDRRTLRRFFATMKAVDHRLQDGRLAEDEAARRAAALVGHVSHADSWALRASRRTGRAGRDSTEAA